jgi:hypothetical protein
MLSISISDAFALRESPMLCAIIGFNLIFTFYPYFIFRAKQPGQITQFAGQNESPWSKRAVYFNTFLTSDLPPKFLFSVNSGHLDSISIRVRMAGTVVA